MFLRSLLGPARWILIAVALTLSVPAVASAQSGTVPVVDSLLLGHAKLDLNLQAPEMTADLSMHWQGGEPESWTVSLWRAARQGSYLAAAAPPMEIARRSGTGATTGRLPLPVVDPEWRWRFLSYSEFGPLELRIQWRSEGRDHEVRDTQAHLWLFTNAGRSLGADDGSSVAPPGGMTPIYNGIGDLTYPPDPYWVRLGAQVAKDFEAKTFLAGGRLRPTVRISWEVPPSGARRVRADVVDSPRKGPAWGAAVYRSANVAPGAPGTTTTLTARLTPKGRALARKVGARRLAARLAATGVVTFFHEPLPGDEGPQKTYVAMGARMRDSQRPKGYPLTQTCRPFPGMPSGFAVFDLLGSVYGSYSCVKGAPLTPVPMG